MAVPSLRNRVLIGAALVSALGFGAGAAVNQVVARYYLTIPEDGAVPDLADAAPATSGAKPSGASDATFEDGPDAPARPARPTSRRGLSQKQYVDAILKRNIFDSTSVGVESAGSGVGEGECRSDANARVLATLVVEPPEFSSALIAEGGGRESKARGYGVGESIGSEGRIVYIAQKKVCLDSGGCLCMGQEGGIKKETASAGEGGISKTSETQITVDSSVIEEALGNVEALAGQIRAVPHKGPDGQVDGYRLSAIKRGSIFEKLGVKNGDVIHAVNGQALTSPADGAAALSALKNERQFSFEVTRRNQRLTLDYNVQ